MPNTPMTGLGDRYAEVRRAVQVVVAMRRANGVCLTRLGQSLLGVLPDGLQHAVPGSAECFVGDDQRLVDEQRQLVEHLMRGHFGPGRDLSRRIEVEAADEHREPTEQRALGVGQQRVRPVDGGPQCLLAPDRGARAAGQQPEPVHQTVQDLVEGQGPNAGRREFDRQWHAVEAVADGGHRAGVVRRDVKVGAHQAGAVGEQVDGVVAQRQRRHPPDRLTRHAERFAARGEQRQLGACADERGGDPGAFVEQVLAVVEHDEHPAVGSEAQHDVDGGHARKVGQTQRADHRAGDDVGVGDRREVDVEDPPVELGPDPAREFDGQPGLADSARPGQRHQAVRAQRRAHLGELGGPADERRELSWKTGRDNRSR